jgi:hypothetical protein
VDASGVYFPEQADHTLALTIDPPGTAGRPAGGFNV